MIDSIDLGYQGNTFQGNKGRLIIVFKMNKAR